MTTAVAEDRLAAMEAKLDAVSHQLDFVAAALREQEGRRSMWDELRRDLAPVTAEAMERVSRELDEVRGFVEPDGLLRLAKRLLRDLPYLEALLDQVESLSALGADLSPLGRDIVMSAMARLDDFQRRGYFALARGLAQVTDQVVAALGEEGMQALAREVPSLVSALREAPSETPGLLRLMWRLRRPGVRRGLVRGLAVLEAVGSLRSGPAPGATPVPPTHQ